MFQRSWQIHFNTPPRYVEKLKYQKYYESRIKTSILCLKRKEKKCYSVVKKNVWLQIRDNSSTGNLLGWRWQVHKGSLFPNTFSQILCCLGKKKRKYPVPFPNKVFIWANSGHIICSKITDTKFDSSVRSWLDLVAVIQCHTNAAELFTGSTTLEKHDNHHYCSSHK